MRRAVLDSTVLVSAFLNRGGPAYELLQKGKAGAFAVCLADDILDEADKVLHYPRIRKRATYIDADISKYIAAQAGIGQLITSLPKLQVVKRDPNDDMIVACAAAAKADHIITRDKDLLDLGSYREIVIISPEAYLELLRVAEP